MSTFSLSTSDFQSSSSSERTSYFGEPPKDWRVHEAMTAFTLSSDTFCWAVRPLRVRRADGHWQRRTPAMAAGLTDHEWTLREGLTFPAVQ
jgi:hypothetical protein